MTILDLLSEQLVGNVIKVEGMKPFKVEQVGRTIGWEEDTIFLVCSRETAKRHFDYSLDFEEPFQIVDVQP